MADRLSLQAPRLTIAIEQSVVGVTQPHFFPGETARAVDLFTDERVVLRDNGYKLCLSYREDICFHQRS